MNENDVKIFNFPQNYGMISKKKKDSQLTNIGNNAKKHIQLIVIDI